jgi:hypothetical protein
MMWEVRLGPEVEAWFLDLCQTDATTADLVAEAIDGIMLDCGQRDDVTRWVHPDLLRQDWPRLRRAFTSQITGRWEQRLPGLASAVA